VLFIGPYRLRNPVLLAPMAGITDAPFRELAWRYGVGYVVSEMLATDHGLWNTPKSRFRRAVADGVFPRAVQIAGSDPLGVADAARRHVDDGAQIIDINFGCPAKKVCRKAAGSQLLRDPDLVEAIARATVGAVPVPVTVKMRTGFAPAQRNGVEVARRLEQVGVAALAVHGRTRACAFGGDAEYETIARIKAHLSIPVFANGDIDSPAKARAVLAATGADGVMVGRGALGAPWLPGLIAGAIAREPTLTERWALIAEHVLALHDFYGAQPGDDRGVRIARKHVRWYLSRMNVDDEVTGGFNRLGNASAQLDWLAAAGMRCAA
jgi:tRNA-dihydrouridine synthase B